MGDTYRPSYSYPWYPYNGYPPPPPPPPRAMPPLSWGPPPPPPPGVYHGGDVYRPQPQQGDFSFRPHDYAPQYPRQEESMRPQRYQDNSRQDYNRQDHGRQENSRNRRDNRRGDNANLNRARERYNHRHHQNSRNAPADRPLLRHHDEGKASEQMLGMTNSQKFMAAEDVSDSEEEHMDESNSDKAENDVNEGESVAELLGLDDDPSTAESQQPPSKRRAVASSLNNTQDGKSEPKWSNPDPYTVLPPVDEVARKKRDVVKLIRKARMDAQGDGPNHNQVAANDDFISFGMEDVREDIPLSITSDDQQGGKGRGVPGAPTGPRPFSHLENLHQQGIPSNNDDTMSSASVGPPPGFAPPFSKMLDNQVNLPGSGIPINGDALALSSKIPTEASLDVGAHFREDVRRDMDANLGDDALGNRKRTYNDVIRGSKKGGDHINGSLLGEWVPRAAQNPTPWVSRSRPIPEDAMSRLHKEICDYYDFVKPQDFEQTIRSELLDRLQKAVGHHIPNTRILCFGSFAAGLYLPNADMDVVVVSNSYLSHGEKVICQNKNQLWRFADFIKASAFARDKIEVIANAKVPLVKFTDRVTGLKVDISFENDTGLTANNTFAEWKQQFPAMPILVTVIKQFLVMRGMNEVVYGGLGGFSVTCLVTSLLQNMPSASSREYIPEDHLGETLLEFLDFYGNRMDIRRTGISMRPAGYFKKDFFQAHGKRHVYQANKGDRVAIMDPNRPDNDISGGSRLVAQIFDRFAKAHKEILDALKSPARFSLLDWCLGGNYEIFTSQRNHLFKLHRQSVGLRGGGLVQDHKPGQDSPYSGMPLNQARGLDMANKQNSPNSAGENVLNANNLPHRPFQKNLQPSSMTSSSKSILQSIQQTKPSRAVVAEDTEPGHGLHTDKRNGANHGALSAHLVNNPAESSIIPLSTAETMRTLTPQGNASTSASIDIDPAQLVLQEPGASLNSQNVSVDAAKSTKKTKPEMPPGQMRARSLQKICKGIQNVPPDITRKQYKKLKAEFEVKQLGSKSDRKRMKAASKASIAEKRATELKQEYPDMANIPNAITTKQRRSMIDNYEGKIPMTKVKDAGNQKSMKRMTRSVAKAQAQARSRASNQANAETNKAANSQSQIQSQFPSQNKSLPYVWNMQQLESARPPPLMPSGRNQELANRCGHQLDYGPHLSGPNVLSQNAISGGEPILNNVNPVSDEQRAQFPRLLVSTQPLQPSSSASGPPKKQRISAKMAPTTVERRAEVARNLRGLSPSDPISLD